MATEAESGIDSRNASHSETNSDKMESRITTVAWLVGISAIAGFTAISEHPTLGEGIGVAAIAAMVTIVSCVILKK
jgi:hypothetical protein